MAKKDKKKKRQREREAATEAAAMAAAVEREAAAAAAAAQEITSQDQFDMLSGSQMPSMFEAPVSAASAASTASTATATPDPSTVTQPADLSAAVQSAAQPDMGSAQVQSGEMTNKPHSAILRTKPEESSQAEALETPRRLRRFARNDGLERSDHHFPRQDEQDSVTRINFDSDTDSVTRISFEPDSDSGSGADSVTRIDFSADPAEDSVTRISFDSDPDSVVRLDFGSGFDSDADSTTRLDLSSIPTDEPSDDSSPSISEQGAIAEPEGASAPVASDTLAQAVSSGATVISEGAALSSALAANSEVADDRAYAQPLQSVQQEQSVQQDLQAQQVQSMQSAQSAYQEQPAQAQSAQQTQQPQKQVQAAQQQPTQQVQQVQQAQSAQVVAQAQPAQQVQQVQPAQQVPQIQQQPFQQQSQQYQQQQPQSQFQQQQQQQTLTQSLASSAQELTAEEKAADREQAANKPTPDEVAVAKSGLERIVSNVETVVIGKREPVSLVVLALIARGHVLLEDLPGTGKTTLVSALARSIACDFSRIQFTPDIMPSDVSGFSIYNQKTNDFEFRPGGVMANLVLADEINRASAKTQSALLEAMEERQVTVDGKTYRLPEPFMVLATQNPIEQFGTYPLPEAQVDRFLVKLSMGYPAFEQEVRVLELGDRAKRALSAVVSGEDVLALREVAARVYASRIVLRYIVEIITATRDNPEVQVGSSPRGGIALLALSRAYALFQGRGYVVPDDVKALAPHVLCHRISLAHEAKVAGRTERQVVESILSGIAVPYYDEAEAQGLK